MPESTKALKFVYDYAKTLFEKRKDNHFEESMKTPLFKREKTAMDLFVHSVSTLYMAMKKTTNPNADSKEITIKQLKPLWRLDHSIQKKALKIHLNLLSGER